MPEPQNNQNQGTGEPIPQGTGGTPPRGVVNSSSNGTSNSGNSAAPGSKPEMNPAGDGAILPAKPKRRRRRRKKKPGLQPGQDVPLILPEKKSSKAVPPDVSQPVAQPVEPPDELDEPIIDDIPSEYEEVPSEPLDTIEPSELEPPVSPELQEPEPSVTIEPPEAPPEPPAPAAPSEEYGHTADIDPSQKIFEEPPAQVDWEDEPLAVEKPEDVLPSEEVQSDEVVSPVEEVPPSEEVLPSDENEANQVSLDQAKKINENLLIDEPAGLDELPQKQGIFGKIFDLLEKLVHGKEQVESAKVEVVRPVITEQVPEGPAILARILKFLFRLAIVVALIIGAFWVGSSLKLTDRITAFFTPKQGLELIETDNSNVVVDIDMLNKWGFMTSKYFGLNHGDLRDLTYNVFFNANYFGRLKDPIFFGQTGISAAIYYGFGREVDYIKNRYIYYVKYLAKIRFANAVKVKDVLDGQVRRDQALDGFIAETQAIFDEGNKLRKEINVQVDDLKVSINTLTPDKDRYELDYFASLDSTQAEKSELLIKKFIETNQKMVELRAKLAALTRLSQLYEADLIIMKVKLDDMSQNRAALITGVTVKVVPGSDLNLIRQ